MRFFTDSIVSKVKHVGLSFGFVESMPLITLEMSVEKTLGTG